MSLKNINGVWVDMGPANSSSKVGNFIKGRRMLKDSIDRINEKVEGMSDFKRKSYFDAIRRHQDKRDMRDMTNDRKKREKEIEFREEVIDKSLVNKLLSKEDIDD